MIWQIFALYLI